MNTFYKSISAAGLLLTAVTGVQQTAQAQLTSGNIVVLQVGSGTALSGASAPVSIKEYTRTGSAQATPVSTIALPTTGPARLVMAGSSTTEGGLTLSADSTRLVFAGYDTTVAFASVASSSAANIRRVIDTVGFSGVAGRADSTGSTFSGGNIRGAAKGQNEDYWAVGSNSGVQYLGNTASASSLSTTATNIRLIQPMNGNLYYATSGVVYRLSGMPMAAPTTSDTVLIVPSGSITGMALNPAETIAYIADDRTAANGGGIQKWTKTNGVWTVSDTLTLGIGARSLAVDWSGTYPVLFATTAVNAANALVRVTDSNAGPGVANSYTTLATAPANTVFRGVSFVPKSCSTPVVSVTSTNISCTLGGAATATVSGTGAFTYAWTGPNNFTATAASITNLTTAGTYAVTVTAPGGCTATANAIITSTATVSATATAAGSTTFCQGDSVRLRANRATGYTYQWLNGTTSISGATDSFLVARISGSYRVRIASGSCADTSSAIAVTVNPLPVTTLTITRDTIFCQGDSVVLALPPATNYTYQWSRNGMNLAGATMMMYTARQTGTYRVRVTSNAGCADSSRMVMVTAKPMPMPVISSVNGLLSLANTTGYTNLQWMLNGAPITGATGTTHVPAANGTYTLTADSNGCTGMSNPVIITNAAVRNLSATTFQVYPNPAAALVTIQPTGVYSVRISDLQGREVLRTTATSAIYIGDLAKGIYQLQLTNNAGETAVLKLVKGN
jgi:hypothetical protein